jgi:prepilin-type N-terminal cleavage/methylation domain-containing protein
VSPRTRHRQSFRRAYTLLELVIVLLVATILTAAAAPKVRSGLNYACVDAACRRIKADLAWARQTALNKGMIQTVTFTPGTGNYSLSGQADLDRPSQSYAVSLSGAPHRTTITSAVLGADAVVIFDRFGMPDSGGTIAVQSGSATGTVTLNSSSGLATIP